MFLFGLGGVGKTSQFATLPPYLGKGLVLDTLQYEGGTEVIEHMKGDIDVRTVRTWGELTAIYHGLRRGELTFEDDGKTPYDWLGIDSTTGVNRIARKKVKREEQRDELEPRYKVTLPNYGTIADLMAVFFERFRLLRMPVIMLAQERTFTHRQTDEEWIGPDVGTIAVVRELVPHPKLIGHMFVQQNAKGRWERLLRVNVSDDHYTKSRSVKGRRLPDIIRSPNLGQIIAYMQGEKGVERPKEGHVNASSAPSGELD